MRAVAVWGGVELGRGSDVQHVRRGRAVGS